MHVPACVLCEAGPEEVVWRDARLRVIVAPVDGLGDVARIIWHAHVAEMTDLGAAGRQHLMAAVWTVEAALRELAKPAKMNVASLGNYVPHLHWHVVPRYTDDAFFPDSIWSARRRTGVIHGLDRGQLAAALAGRFASGAQPSAPA